MNRFSFVSPRVLRVLGVLVLGGVLSGVLGCGQHFDLEAPDDFAELTSGGGSATRHAYRATSADGAILAVREVDNTQHASRAFWAQAVRNRLRRAGGYALLSEQTVRSADGTEGQQLRFGRDEGASPYEYWVTLFVTHERVFVVEAGGRREPFEAQRAAIEQAIATLRLR